MVLSQEALTKRLFSAVIKAGDQEDILSMTGFYQLAPIALALTLAIERQGISQVTVQLMEFGSNRQSIQTITTATPGDLEQLRQAYDQNNFSPLWLAILTGLTTEDQAGVRWQQIISKLHS